MEIDYIFLEKDKKAKNKDYVQTNNLDTIPFYKKIFLHIAKEDTLTEKKFDIEYDNKKFKIYHNCICNNNGEYFFKIYTLGKENLRTAKVLNNINNEIKRSIQHKDYYIIQTYDESSKYLCDKIYPKFNEFERKIRRLIYLILIKSFGKLWAQETISAELKDKINNKVHSTDAIIEQALQEMDIKDLENFLFEPRYWFNLENVINNDLSLENVKGLEKDEILKRLEKIQKYKLWDKCFSEIKITDLEEKLENIRKLRNKVAHFKEITLDAYADGQKLLKSIIKEIDVAIEKASLTNYDLSMSKDILESFVDMTKRIMESINTTLKPLSSSLVFEAFTSVLEQIELSKPKIPNGIFPQLVNPIWAKPIIEIPKLNDIFEKVVTPMPSLSIANELLLTASATKYIRRFELPPSLTHTPKLPLDIPDCIQPTFKKFKNTKKYTHRKH